MGSRLTERFRVKIGAQRFRGLGFNVQGLALKVLGFGYTVQDSEFGICIGFGFGFGGLGFRI